MNSKQFKLLIVAFFIICGLGVYLLTRDRGSWQEASHGKLFKDFPLNEVAAITIRGASNTVDLTKKDEKWVVADRGGYPANFSTIKDILTKIWELKVLRPIPVGPSQLGSLDLLEPGKGKNSGTELIFKDKDGKKLHSLLLGKEHMRESAQSSPMGGGGFPDGRYLMPDGKNDSVALVQEAFSSVQTQPSSWLDRDFFKVEKPKSIAVTTTNSWKVERETEAGEWKLADAKDDEKLDSSKTSSFNYALSSPSFEDVVVGKQAEDIDFKSGDHIVIETFEGFTYSVDARKGEDDKFYLKVDVKADLPKERAAGKDEKPEDKTKLDKEFQEKQDKLKEKLAKEQAYSQWTYEVSNWTLNSLLKSRSDLLKKPEPPKPAAASPATAVPSVSPAEEKDQ